MDKLIVTDLDGTLLDHDTYEFGPAVEALGAARAAGALLVLCTSKTRVESEWWRERLGLAPAPLIVENGGAVVWADGSVTALGVAYEELRRVLAACAATAGCKVQGFGDMTVDEVAELCGMTVDWARMARQREWDEPFIVDAGSVEGVLDGIKQAGLLWSRGGRFLHIHGVNDKAAAVRTVLARLQPARTLGLGDGLNDASFLNEMDVAVLMPSASLGELRLRVPKGSVAEAPGPSGWAQAVLRFLST